MNKELATTLPPEPSVALMLQGASADRFWSKVNKDGPTMAGIETPCHVWTASTDKDGYGQYCVNGKNRKAHRIAWTLSFGEIIGRSGVLHRCDNPPCCNPAHLFLGSNKDNAEDRERKGRGNQPRGDACGSRLYPESRPRGESNGRAKLTARQVLEMRGRFANESVASLAREFGVSTSAAFSAIKGENWKHINSL